MNEGLHKAAREGDLATLKVLIAQGADINEAGPHNWSLLVAAVAENHAGMARWLLDNGANPDNPHSEDGKNALHWAASRGCVEVTRLLLERGCKTSTRDKQGNYTPLHLAAVHAPVETAVQTIALLLDYGKAKLEARDKWGMTPIMYAATSSREAVLRYLLQRGANREARERDGRTLLMRVAGELSVPSTVQLLLEQGADIEAQDPQGRTALSLSAWYAGTDSARILLKHGAAVNHQDATGKTPLAIAVGPAPNNRWLNVLQNMRKRGGKSVRARHRVQLAEHRAEATTQAAWAARAETVRVLLEADADTQLRDNENKTAMDWAQEQDGGEAVVEVLRAANVRRPNHV